MTKASVPMASRPSRWRSLLADLLVAPMEARSWVAASSVVAMVAVFGALTYAVGGTSAIPPHWFYIPIAVAGARFGVAAALATALVSGIISGPIMPADVSASIAQHPSEWLVRTGFFLTIGAVVPVLLRKTAHGVIEHRDREALARRLDEAMRQSQLRLHFQPIVSVESGEVTGAEALLRWETPDEGLLSAESIVPAAEATGRIVPIGKWVIDEACATLNTWSAALGDARFVMSVNVAAAQLHGEDLVGIVLDALSRHSIDPSRLCLEITESSVIEDLPRAIRVLTELREAGVVVAIDDFGTGFSSLSYLRYLPFDTIKIDGHFLQDLGHDEDAQSMVRNVATLARDLHKETVAEHVETGIQWRNVALSGCTHGQGHLFSPPLPDKAFGALIASRQVWPAPGRLPSG